MPFGASCCETGASTGRRSLALAVGAGAGVLAYAASGIVPRSRGWLGSATIRRSLWLIGTHPLDKGLHWCHVGLMLGLSLGWSPSAPQPSNTATWQPDLSRARTAGADSGCS